MIGPSTRRKLAFWLLIGVFSVVFIEVPSGSTKFAFFRTIILVLFLSV